MLKKLSLVILASTCGMLMAANVHAADETTQSEHTSIGQRSESVEVRMAQLETRAKMAALHPEEKKESANVNKNIAKSMLPNKKYNVAKSLYYTSHPSAYQHPVAISYFGESVELMDGSVWTVASSDAYKVTNWLTTDLLIITPNHSWFSNYGFRLTNQNTGDSVAVNLSLGPIAPMYNSFYTHWIVGIDYYYNIIYLEDGSVWNMSGFDREIIDQWINGDVVIIGVNDGWLSSSNPNVLINVAMLNFAVGSASF